MRQLDSNRRLAVAISLEHAKRSRLIPASEIYCFKNEITTYSLQILVKKDFLLLEELNTVINAATASGLIVKWLSNTKVRANYQYQSDEFGNVTMDSFYSFFILWIGIVMVPWFVLLLENIIFYMTHKPNPHKICLYFELFIDGDRHFLLDDIRFE